ncbi:VIT1/CCC1 transporter family protein [Candidatus Neptunochlamydia vexilliferae]|uniref:VIT1/CCC1 transporter family protein n=1 Tax=Candidatus Neptunichlamydia vexilliferae TaxID=1651774 RepID=UPI001890C474|nr:VIT1/CCC1 transporter family protein [Candidatus Neptunochlamydia vexilliferae]
MNEKSHNHFEGKDAIEHLKAAREKGARATSEVHGAETPGYITAAADSIKETAIILLGIGILLSAFGFSPSRAVWVLGFFSCGWLFWRVGRSALLGWARLERLHRLIEQERWEIEHHRAQEKEELTAMYQQKGLTGKLLDQVIEVLMADDNRLLRVMLEEELGLTLESYEHPLKQAVGAGVGVLIAALTIGVGFFFGGFVTAAIFSGLIFAVATLVASKLEGNELIKSVVWNLAVGILAIGTIHFLARWTAHALHL